MLAEKKLVVALDVDNLIEAKRLTALLPAVQWFKVGSQLFTSSGPAVVEMLKHAGKSVFLDLKFHDIPNTVAKAAAAAVALGVDMFNVHIEGGPEMMTRTIAVVQEAVAASGEPKPIIIGVTVLTSLDRATLAYLMNRDDLDLTDEILRRAEMAQTAGLDGVVASAHEVVPIKARLGADFVVVTPGIRPGGDSRHDQARVDTPSGAIANGSDYLVIGRSILQAEDPNQAALQILSEMEQALK